MSRSVPVAIGPLHTSASKREANRNTPAAIGSIEPGKDAGFLVFDGDPWDGRNKVQATYIDGEKAFEADGPHPPV